MSDPNVAADVGIIADHNYVANNGVGDQTVPAAIPSYGKALWETEVALLSGSDSSIANGVYYAQRIYLYMTQAQANAYHYWWLVASRQPGIVGYQCRTGQTPVHLWPIQPVCASQLLPH